MIWNPPKTGVEQVEAASSVTLLPTALYLNYQNKI